MHEKDVFDPSATWGKKTSFFMSGDFSAAHVGWKNRISIFAPCGACRRCEVFRQKRENLFEL
jgi:hypothetical protein